MNSIEREHEADRWLESGLREFSKAEPRDGLESRVLASLQSERNRIASRRRWWWALGMVTATAAIALAVWLGHGDQARTRDDAGATARHEAGGAEPPNLDSGVRRAPRPPGAQFSKKTLRRSSSPRTGPIPDVAAAPRLERFPALAPLSDQEKLLARYVQQFPQRAALIASAQTDLREHNELEMAAPWPKNPD